MAKITYEIVPNPDTVIVLINPNAEFAPWSEDEDEEDDKPTDSSQTSPPDDPAEENEIRYAVSRCHLTAASPVFERMLSANWKEGTPNEADGLYYVTAEHWDSEALLYVLQIFHLRHRRVPRMVTLEMLARVAVLIDFYECAEALEMFTEEWTKSLRDTSCLPSTICRDLMLWICIAWVLKLPDVFEQTAQVAVKYFDQTVPNLGLPIISCVNEIEEARRQAIRSVLLSLQALLGVYRSADYKCPSGHSFECGSMLYGALSRQMEHHGLLPIPASPYSWLSVSGLFEKMKLIRSPLWYHDTEYSSRFGHDCNLKEEVEGIKDPVARITKGLLTKTLTISESERH